MFKISVVVPVFRNSETVEETFNRISSTIHSSFSAATLEVVFVEDGSGDNSWDELTKLKKKKPDTITLVKLSRNFGQVSAILAGYEAATGDAVITISADLQDPTELMADMLLKWQEGNDIVIANRMARNDDAASTLFSKVAYGVARKANPKMPEGGFDYLLLSRRAKDVLITFKGRHRFFQGDILWLGFPTTFIPYERLKRPMGKSGWSFSKKFKYFTDLILDSSYLPIRLMSGLGFITAGTGLLYALIIVLSWLNNSTPFNGWAPLMVAVLVIGGMIMMMLGIIGEYLWRIYDDVKARPLYVLEEVVPANSESMH